MGKKSIGSAGASGGGPVRSSRKSTTKVMKKRMTKTATRQKDRPRRIRCRTYTLSEEARKQRVEAGKVCKGRVEAPPPGVTTDSPSSDRSPPSKACKKICLGLDIVEPGCFKTDLEADAAVARHNRRKGQEDLNYPQADGVYFVGEVVLLEPEVVGGANSWTVEPALPEGLLLDPTTGIIRGTCSNTADEADYVVTAPNDASAVLAFAVIAPTAPPPEGLTYPDVVDNYVVGSPMAVDPSLEKGFAAKFWVEPALPSGIVLDEKTGVISGTPEVATELTTYWVTATNAVGDPGEGCGVSFQCSELPEEEVPVKEADEQPAPMSCTEHADLKLTICTVQRDRKCDTLDKAIKDGGAAEILFPRNFDPFACLGLSKTSKPPAKRKLKDAFRKAALRWHPDHCREVSKTTWEGKMQEVNLAREVLSDARKLQMWRAWHPSKNEEMRRQARTRPPPRAAPRPPPSPPPPSSICLCKIPLLHNCPAPLKDATADDPYLAATDDPYVALNDPYGGGGDESSVADYVGDYQAQEVAPQVAAAPPPPCAPRFCCNHDSSDKRVKCEPVSRACKSCGMEVVSSYKDFQLCPPCSDKEQRCLICGANAPKSSSYIPQNHVSPQGGQMQQSERSRPVGNQANNLPPPPPPPASSHRAGNANVASGGPSRQPQGDSFAPADTTRSMHVSRQAGNHQQQQQQQLAPEYSTHINEQNFSTILPQNMRVPLGGPPMGQQRGVLANPRNGQMANKVDDESFGGFLRYVAADVWGMCNAQQNQRFDSFGGPTPSYPHGFKRGGA